MILQDGQITLPFDDYVKLNKRIEALEAALKPFADAYAFYATFPQAFGHPANDKLTLRDTANTHLDGYPHYQLNPIKVLRCGDLHNASNVYYKREE